MITYIGVMNASSAVPDADFRRMVAACSVQLERDVCKPWGWIAPVVCPIEKLEDALPGAPVLTIRDFSDEAGAAGYHVEDEGGREMGYVFARDILKYGSLLTGPDSVSAVLSHEVIELIGDPFCTRWEDGPRRAQGTMYAFELADPVQGHTYPIGVDGVDVSVSNFILPAWFDGDLHGKQGTGLVDYLGVCPSPFEVAPGGYMIVRGPRGEHAVFGSIAPGERTLVKLNAKLGRAGRRNA